MVHSISAEHFRGETNHNLVGVIPPYVPLQKEIDVQGKHVVGVFADKGGLDAFLPVITLLRNAACNVTLYLTATCEKQFTSGALSFQDSRIVVHTGGWDRDAIVAFFYKVRPDILVIGASQSDEGVTAGAQALANSIGKKIGIEDLHLSMGPILDRAGIFLNTLCVIDEFAKEETTRRHLGAPFDIAVTGGPQFDFVPRMKKTFTYERATLRKKWGITDTDMLLLLVGGKNGTEEMLQATEEAVKMASIEGNAKVMLRAHSRATDPDKDLTRGYLERSKLQFVEPERGFIGGAELLLPGADIVISGFSTVLHTAALFGMPGVVSLMTPKFVHDLQKEKELEKPPVAMLNACWCVKNGNELGGVIQKITNPIPGAELSSVSVAQSLIASLSDNRAADRVFQEMQKLLQ